MFSNGKKTKTKQVNVKKIVATVKLLNEYGQKHTIEETGYIQHSMGTLYIREADRSLFYQRRIQNGMLHITDNADVPLSAIMSITYSIEDCMQEAQE